ncbi:MAG: hypothetical protein M3Y33_09955, partial [Actinomycetota bacterium]|nr:hypothetical protein [Actinomycetota bacterium]
AVLTTAGDSAADWLRAGQALDRLLLRAAARWVFASMQSQPLELPPLRAQIRDRLGLDGMPQLLLQFGRSNIAPATARRPTAEIMDHDGPAQPGRPSYRAERPPNAGGTARDRRPGARDSDG